MGSGSWWETLHRPWPCPSGGQPCTCSSCTIQQLTDSRLLIHNVFNALQLAHPLSLSKHRQRHRNDDFTR